GLRGRKARHDLFGDRRQPGHQLRNEVAVGRERVVDLQRQAELVEIEDVEATKARLDLDRLQTPRTKFNAKNSHSLSSPPSTGSSTCWAPRPRRRRWPPPASPRRR